MLWSTPNAQRTNSGDVSADNYLLNVHADHSHVPLSQGVVSLTVKPNPFNQSLLVSVKNTPLNVNAEGESGKRKAEIFSLSLLSANGITVANKPITANSTLQWDTATLPAGVYLLKLAGKNGTVQSTQIVKLNK